MPSQRPYFLSSFIAAFRQQRPTLQANPQPNKHSNQTAAVGSSTPSSAIATSAAAAAAAASSAQANSRSPPPSVAIHSPRGDAASIPIPNPSASGRRRGSDSSSEGFRDAIGAERWYIGGRTAGGEEKFFKLGVVRRVRSNDGLSLDRLSL
ncbi:uncharacterized protein MAM_03446 [Metarhizium album ARSEF 1941]|uniref:Uncharacterized protein n=1 Tax=Metarhizium album (strain ARSEF 1941) TaxID=1081103 RepID=A0A0B2WZH3_METAS|nr:uncharacterized protein MAM_03446 [Metarhizium album ARSEF 1941]KHN98984.1 hypothetical protein MAM_03446 [Metarhizium album ARSEF 1941]